MSLLKRKPDETFAAFKADYELLPETERHELEQDLKSAWLLISSVLATLEKVPNAKQHAGKIVPKILKRVTLTKNGEQVLIAEISPHFPFLAEVISDLIK